MINFNINYPSLNHKNYIESIFKFCKENRLSLILKGSLAKDTATKYSDIDLIILGNIEDSKVNELITRYGNPVMTNFTENPKGILILVYDDNIAVDLDIRETISPEDLENSKILLKYDTNFIINNKEVIRKEIVSKYMPNRPIWYKTLRLLHRGTIKYLSNKNHSAYNLLSEIKESLTILNINDLDLKNNFEEDIQCIFKRICKEFQVDSQIEVLFNTLFREF